MEKQRKYFFQSVLVERHRKGAEWHLKEDFLRELREALKTLEPSAITEKVSFVSIDSNSVREAIDRHIRSNDDSMCQMIGRKYSDIRATVLSDGVIGFRPKEA